MTLHAGKVSRVPKAYLRSLFRLLLEPDVECMGLT
mgnify:CR=1 FL=1